MSFISMRTELRGSVPKLPFAYTATLINRAWQTVRTRNLWSFLLFNGQWIAPAQYTGTSCTTQIGSSTVTLSPADVTAINAALLTQPYSAITSRQFRIASTSPPGQMITSRPAPRAALTPWREAGITPT